MCIRDRCSLNTDYAATLRFAASLGVRYATCSGLIPSGSAEGAESRATRLTEQELTAVLQDAVSVLEELSMELDFTSPGWLPEETLRALGLHGVKLHPDIQGFRLDDPRCFALAEQCEGVLPLLLHTGDSRYDFSNPNRLIPLLRRFPRLTVIGAHFGGYTIWQEAARQLAGRFENLWVDCSSSFFAMDVAAGRALIDAYGADRVLFGTDYPMWDPQHELARLRGMHLAPETERKILYDNAAALFGLEGEN